MNEEASDVIKVDSGERCMEGFISTLSRAINKSSMSLTYKPSNNYTVVRVMNLTEDITLYFVSGPPLSDVGNAAEFCKIRLKCERQRSAARRYLTNSMI